MIKSVPGVRECYLLPHLDIPRCHFKDPAAELMHCPFAFAAEQPAKTVDEERLARVVRQNTLEQGGTTTSLDKIAHVSHGNPSTWNLRLMVTTLRCEQALLSPITDS